MLAAPPPPPVPTVMIVAVKTDFWLIPPEGDVTWYDLEFVASFIRQQAAQARDLGARIVVAEESDHLVPFQQPEVMIASDPSSQMRIIGMCPQTDRRQADPSVPHTR